MSLFFLNILTVLILLVSVIIRETIRAYVSYKLGDELPAILGRLSFNPFAYFNKEDLILPLILVIFGFPVIVMPKIIPISYSMLKKPKRDALIINTVSLMSNFVIAFIMVFIAVNFKLTVFKELVYIFGRINVFLFVLNLLPIIPFDGGQIISLLFNVRCIYLKPFLTNALLLFLILSGILNMVSKVVLIGMFRVLI